MSAQPAAALVRGARAFLRHPRADDQQEVLALREASSQLHARWEPLTDGHARVSPEAYGRFVSGADSAAFQKHLICRNDDNCIVGYVGLGQIFLGPFCSAYLGYWTGQPFVRQGYAVAGILLCLRRAFGELGLHRVEANIIPSNAASLATIRRCGFRKEGFSPRYLQIDGRWQDHERWALTIEDWDRRL